MNNKTPYHHARAIKELQESLEAQEKALASAKTLLIKLSTYDHKTFNANFRKEKDPKGEFKMRRVTLLIPMPLYIHLEGRYQINFETRDTEHVTQKVKEFIESHEQIAKTDKERLEALTKLDSIKLKEDFIKLLKKYKAYEIWYSIRDDFQFLN